MTTTARNWTYILTTAVVHMFMLGAAAVSFTHIIETSTMLGLGWESWTVPFLVDGIAVLGLVGRSHRFAESTRRAGLWLTLGAGTLSLTCNVYAGHNLGQRLYGVLVVAGFIATETYAAKLRPAPAAPAQPTAEELATAALAAKRSEAARRAAATRKRNAELAASNERAAMRNARRALAAQPVQ
jgi:hypothetical protein